MNEDMQRIKTLQISLQELKCMRKEVRAMIPQSINPMLEAGDYRGKVTPNANDGYDFHTEYFYKHYEASGIWNKEPFRAVIRDLPKDLRIEKATHGLLQSFNPWRGDFLLPDEICSLDLRHKEVADLYADGKIEIEGRDAKVDAKIARILCEISENEYKTHVKLRDAEFIESYKAGRMGRVEAKMICGGNCANCQCSSCAAERRRLQQADECSCCQPEYIPMRRERHDCLNHHP